jgi:LacI family transcriptional regulator
VFAANDLMAIGALIAIREAGLRAPDDVSVVGFDDIPQASIVTPRLTTVAVPKYAMGHTAAELLLGRLDGHRSERVSVELPHSLVIRESTGPPPSQARVASIGRVVGDRVPGGHQPPAPVYGGEPAR